MGMIANWNGHTFEVSSRLWRSFTDLTVAGGCETTEKNDDYQKYEERKYGNGYTISMTVILNAQTGVSDVYAEAMQFVQEATEGATGYFYMGDTKLVPAQVMLTQAEVTEVVTMPGRGRPWISASVKLTFRQGARGDFSGDGTESQKASVERVPLFDRVKYWNKEKAQLLAAQIASQNKIGGGLEYQAGNVERARQAADSAEKILATTGRAAGVMCEITNSKITPVGKNLPAVDVRQ